MASYLQKTDDVNLFESIQPIGESAIKISEHNAKSILDADGVVMFKNVIDLDELHVARKYTREHIYMGDQTDTVIIDDHKHIVFAKGRQDTWPIPVNITIPKFINELIGNTVDYGEVRECERSEVSEAKTKSSNLAEWLKRSSIGALTLDKKTHHMGKWHRDIMPLFNIGSTKENDTYTVSLPDFYFTLFIPLTPCNRQNGATEMIIGSHIGINGPLAVAECEPGDLIVMNGKLIHRATPNFSDVDRDMLYIIYCAKWYDEEKF